MHANEEREFREYVQARLPGLRRTAFFLCGDWDRADDLAQTTLIRLHGAWRRPGVRDALDAYARRILVRVAIDERRRPWRRERSTEILHDDIAADGSPFEDRDELLRALGQLPQQQRAVVVLRYWDDMSIEDTAAALGISTGTVKSHSWRALGRLRELLPDQADHANDQL